MNTDAVICQSVSKCLFQDIQNIKAAVDHRINYRMLKHLIFLLWDDSNNQLVSVKHVVCGSSLKYLFKSSHLMWFAGVPFRIAPLQDRSLVAGCPSLTHYDLFECKQFVFYLRSFIPETCRDSLNLKAPMAEQQWTCFAGLVRFLGSSGPQYFHIWRKHGCSRVFYIHCPHLHRAELSL